MKNSISVSTGLVYRLTNDRNEMIRRIREFPIDGIELSFADPEYLFDFSITQENLEYLKSLRYNSIHAPWKNIVYGNNSLSRKVLERIEGLYQQINARNVVFHKGLEDDLKILGEFNFNASIENDDWKKGSNTPEKVERELKTNPNLRLTFDFAHALTISQSEIPIYLTKFRDNITQIHLSMLSREMKDHWFLHKYDSEEMRKLLRLIPEDIPIVLECVASDETKVQLVGEEIRYLKAI